MKVESLSEKKKKILLVEDEVEAAKIVRDYLEQAHYAVDLRTDGQGVVEHVRAEPPDLILLDIMLPVVDGVTICREVRAFCAVPIIMLTARVDEIDRMLGYELGADDYICKPVNPREILIRVKAVLRRSNHVPESAPSSLLLDESKQLAVYMDKTLSLTGTEFKLLKLLFTSDGRVYSRKQIIEALDDGTSKASERSIDTCVKKLRRKIAEVADGENPIRSVYGVGYKYESG